MDTLYTLRVHILSVALFLFKFVKFKKVEFFVSTLLFLFDISFCFSCRIATKCLKHLVILTRFSHEGSVHFLLCHFRRLQWFSAGFACKLALNRPDLLPCALLSAPHIQQDVGRARTQSHAVFS